MIKHWQYRMLRGKCLAGRKTLRSDQSGASTAEYLVVMIVTVAMLFLPIPGQNESVMEMMVQGFKDSHHHYVWGMSYPL
jgi:hypothetical protein